MEINRDQYLATVYFEDFYRNRQNYGLNKLEKDKDLIIGKELFKCWDQKKRGRISVREFSENLISFGLSMSKNQVMDMLKVLLYKKANRDDSDNGDGGIEEIEMKEFIRIFERD